MQNALPMKPISNLNAIQQDGYSLQYDWKNYGLQNVTISTHRIGELILRCVTSVNNFSSDLASVLVCKTSASLPTIRPLFTRPFSNQYANKGASTCPKCPTDFCSAWKPASSASRSIIPRGATRLISKRCDVSQKRSKSRLKTRLASSSSPAPAIHSAPGPICKRGFPAPGT